MGQKPKVLLHVCCGPCATAVIEKLSLCYDVVCFWYNPNIEPLSEYERRLASMRTVAQYMQVPLIVEPRQSGAWRAAVTGWEDEPEGGRRCRICFEHRLKQAAHYAVDYQINYLATTLTVSPHKDAEQINALGRCLGEAVGIDFLEETWRKDGGFQRSVELSRELGLYRQDYCGCHFSRQEQVKERADRSAGQ